MIKTYTTVTKEIKNPWDYHGWTKSTSQSSFHEDQGLKTNPLTFREIFERERAHDEAHPFPSPRKQSWSHLFLQGWKLLFEHVPQQQSQPTTKPQESYVGEGPKKQEEDLEPSHLHLYARDLRQPDGVEDCRADFRRDMPVTTQQEIYARELLDKGQANRESQPRPKSNPFSWERLRSYQDNDRELLKPFLSAQQLHRDAEEVRETLEALKKLTDHSVKRVKDQKFFPLMECGTEIKQEEPSFKAFYHRDERLLEKKQDKFR